MRMYKQRPDKKQNSLIFAGFFVFILLSFFSITTVYAIDDENITSDIDTNPYDNSLDIYVPNDNIYAPNNTLNADKKSMPNSIKVNVKNQSESPNENINEENNDLPSSEKRNNLEKIDGKTTSSQSIDENGIDLIIDLNDYIPIQNYNDINDYINQNIVVFISSNSQGNGYENLYNFIKKVANINFNKFDNENEDILILEDHQSSSYQTQTILFFIKIFMDYHNHGKEHLNSF